MKNSIYYLLFIVVFISCRQNSSLELSLPPRLYCSQLSEVSIYYENLIQYSKHSNYTFSITPELGIDNSKKYKFDIQEKASRNFKLNVVVLDESGRKVTSGSTEVCYTVPKTSSLDTVSVLITGNSLTAAGIFPEKIESLFLNNIQIPIIFLGTKESNGGTHEGYGGKTWEWFSQNIESPFVFDNSGDDYTLNFNRYFEEVVKNKPDFVVIELGINDCFRADTTSIETIDATIDEMLVHTEYYLKKLIDYEPDIQIGICLPPAANTNETGFVASYGVKYKQSGWTKIQRRMSHRLIKYFNNNFQSNCSIIPLDVNFDAFNGYPVDNGVHPNVYGYHQIASSIFNWLLYSINA